MGRREDNWPRGAPTPVNFRHGYGGEEWRIRPYRGSIDPAERWRRWRRSRRGYRRTGQCVFAVVCAHDDGDAQPAMAEGCCGVALRAVKAREGNGETQRECRGVAFIWSSSTRRGDLGRAWTPRGETLLRRSAMTDTVRFLKTAIQYLMTVTVSDISKCQHG